MNKKHIGFLSYKAYVGGEEGTKEKIKDMVYMIRYIFNDVTDMGEKVIDNIFTIAGGDVNIQFQLLNDFIMILSPVAYECGAPRIMKYEELVECFPMGNMNMNAIYSAFDIPAKRILQMKETIHNLSEALEALMKEDIDG